MHIPASDRASNWQRSTQGLRGIAVLAVLLYHAQLPFSGGYLGVDVFFAISGFVITAAILRQVERDGRFSFWRFSWRRFMRLMPALSLLVVVDLLLSALLLSPGEELRSVVLTGLGAATGIANIVIAQTTGGYFEPAAEYNSLLQTWSLSVELQFYVFFPLAVIVVQLVRRKRLSARFLAVVLSTIGVTSLSVAILDVNGLPNRIGVRIFDNNVFYSPLSSGLPPVFGPA